MAIQNMVSGTQTALANCKMTSPARTLESLLPALARLDRRIERALELAPLMYGDDLGEEGPHGLCISADEIERLLARTPGAPLFASRSSLPRSEKSVTEYAAQETRLKELFALTEFDLDVLLVALAPEIDLRYERIYAYLQDDVTKKRPTIDLALNLLCETTAEKLDRRTHFAEEAPLLRLGLLETSGDGANPVPVLARTIQVDDRIVRAFLNPGGLDSRLKNFCTLVEGRENRGTPALSPEVQKTIPALAATAWSEHRPVRFYFQGQQSTGKRATAMALAATLGVPLLVVDFGRFTDAGHAGLNVVLRVFREARLLDALLYITGLEALRASAAGILQDVFSQLEQHSRPAILAGAERWIPVAKPELAIIPVEFSIPDMVSRRTEWSARLALHGLTLAEADSNDLAARFRLTAGQIGEAVEDAVHQAQWRSAWARQSGGESIAGPPECVPTIEDLYAAARAQCGHELARLSRKITPRYQWHDIVLPEDQLKQLQEISEQARYREVVFGAWGFDRKLTLGKGLNILFAGPPGTGKTMAAEVLASDLKLDLYKIDLAQVVNKYIGETEKNLDRIFTAAENSNAILFFDEADALFGKRSEVRDSHDRYANIEISYLLQKMEEYEGISILATNLRQNLDDAFVRRLQAIVEFPFPDEEYRQRIWEVTFPLEAPLADDVDFLALGREIPLAGGNVKNMALAASFFAAADGGKITMAHMVEAAHREFQKMGRTWIPSALLQNSTAA
jgi:SpoVK/Ycf46/Vps4 family AAA+-type ATPase